MAPVYEGIAYNTAGFFEFLLRLRFACREIASSAAARWIRAGCRFSRT
jgi:hypothetical protein